MIAEFLNSVNEIDNKMKEEKKQLWRIIARYKDKDEQYKSTWEIASFMNNMEQGD